MNVLVFISVVILVFGGVYGSIEHNPLIINSDEVENAVPSHVHLRIDSDEVGVTHSGSGTLIRTNVVITVAENVAGFTGWNCGMGQPNWGSLRWIRANGFFIHVNYDATNLRNNMALLRLSETIIPTPILNPAIFANTPNVPAVGTEGRVTGFGIFTQEHNFLAGRLRVAHKTVISPEACGIAFGLYFGNQAENFCAQNGTTNFCGGDQGAGFLIDTGTGVPSLVGLASTLVNRNNCQQNAPGLYVRPQNYFDLLTFVMNYNVFTDVPV